MSVSPARITIINLVCVLLDFGCVIVFLVVSDSRRRPEFKLVETIAQDEFIGAFAGEPECHGIVMHLNDKSSARISDIRVHYWHDPNYPGPPPRGYVVVASGTPDFVGDTPQEAVKQACQIIKSWPYVTYERSHHMLQLLSAREKAEKTLDSFLEHFR